MIQRKRLIYIPGLISLIGILIALPSFYKKNIPIKEYCLTLFLPTDNVDKRSYHYTFSKYKLEKDIAKKKKIKFELDNEEDDRIKMEMIRYEALKLKYTKDTSSVVLINFSNSTTYGDFISVLEICVADDHKRYASWDNKFVIFGEWPKKKIEQTNTITPIYCGTKPYVKPEPTPSFINSIIKNVKNNYTHQGLYLLIGFLALILSHFVSRKLQAINIAKTPN